MAASVSFHAQHTDARLLDFKSMRSLQAVSGELFAGDAVMADNATAMARNPAAMALFDQYELSVGTLVANTDVRIKDISYEEGATQKPKDTSNLSGVSPIPELFFIAPITKSWHAGVGVYSNFGSSLHFDEDFVANDLGGQTVIKTLNVQVSSSYRLNSQWSLGAGLDLIYGNTDIKRNEGDISLLEMQTSGFAVGAHAGVVYEPTKTDRFGLSYRYSPRLATTGKISKADSNLDPETQENDTLTMNLPSMVEFSAYHQVLPQYAVHYSFQYTTWSDFDKMSTQHFGTLNTYNYQDTFHLALGNTLSDQF